MSESIYVKLDDPVSISISELCKRANETINKLLNQKGSIALDIKFVDTYGAEFHDALSPNILVGSFVEENYIKGGCNFSYALNEYWEFYGSEVPFYEFDFGGFRLDADSILTAVCISVLVAFASITSVNFITDTGGVFSSKDKLDDLMAISKIESEFSVRLDLPLQEAISQFYSHLPRLHSVVKRP